MSEEIEVECDERKRVLQSAQSWKKSVEILQMLVTALYAYFEGSMWN